MTWTFLAPEVFSIYLGDADAFPFSCCLLRLGFAEHELLCAHSLLCRACFGDPQRPYVSLDPQQR